MIKRYKVSFFFCLFVFFQYQLKKNEFDKCFILYLHIDYATFNHNLNYHHKIYRVWKLVIMEGCKKHICSLGKQGLKKLLFLFYFIFFFNQKLNFQLNWNYGIFYFCIVCFYFRILIFFYSNFINLLGEYSLGIMANLLDCDIIVSEFKL